MTYFVEETEDGQKVFKTTVVDSRKAGVLGSDLSLRVLIELSKKPQCAMDVARRLKEHEQKIYYHVRRLEGAGIVKLIGREKRVGSFAKIYSVTSPYMTVKLFEGDHVSDLKTKPAHVDFFRGFIKDGRLNATIVVGSPEPHGKYGAQAYDAPAAIDLALMLGTFVKDASPNYKLDTEMRDEDMGQNLILIGGPKANIIIDRINASLPVYFDTRKDFNIVSKMSGSVYSVDHVGMVVKMRNPYDAKKEILVLSGKHFNGTKAAVVAMMRHMRKLNDVTSKDGSVARVVRGIDRNSDGKIDDVEFLE
ncbi:MAG: helix-turn-helix domain-containing protein [Candidatus Aenigmarchaeota archaeon]|nr:helix-turn-helix domain-containing protein [Candidatus Aenigmarchaeota archaeon]